MNKNVHDAIRNEYDSIRKKSDEELEMKKKGVYEHIPGIELIDKQIFQCGLKYNRLILASHDYKDTLELLEKEMDELKLQKKKLLAENDYPDDYLRPDNKCRMCMDTGFLTGSKQRCSCYTQKLIKALYDSSNLELTEHENFSVFGEAYYPDIADLKKYGLKASPRENIIKIKNRCHNFINNFRASDEKNLFFNGPAGTGKTFMANCIAYELLNMGFTVLYQTSPVLFNTISEYKMSMNQESGMLNTAYKRIFDVQLLIIDDLGTEPKSDSRYAELLSILNIRQINNMKKPCKTIISTNFGPRNILEYYTQRFTSRLNGFFDILKFAGDDIRMIKARQ